MTGQAACTAKHVVLTEALVCKQAFQAHPDKPSEARCEDLAQAWHDPYTPQAPER